MQHRISVGALVMDDERLLLARHHKPGIFDYWSPPGGGVEGVEELSTTAERETFEETGLRVKTRELAYIDELIDNNGRMLKLWYFAECLDGQLDVTSNPAGDERIVEARWFSRYDMPSEPVFPPILTNEFWDHIRGRAVFPIKLPLLISYF